MPPLPQGYEAEAGWPTSQNGYAHNWLSPEAINRS
jgi:hypothetical protein